MIQSAKRGFLAIFWTQVFWIDLTLHIMADLNVFHHLATLPGHEGSFKRLKNFGSWQLVVGHTEISVTALTISQIFGTMIEGNKQASLTRLDFPGKLQIIQKLSKICFFRQFLFFCKKLVNTNEKRMIFLKSPVYFCSPCKISCLGKVWFIQKWVPSDRN